MLMEAGVSWKLFIRSLHNALAGYMHCQPDIGKRGSILQGSHLIQTLEQAAKTLHPESYTTSQRW